MQPFTSRIDTGSETFATNREEMLALVQQLRELEGRAEAKSESRREKFHARGQLTPRERVAAVLDPGSPYLQLLNVRGYLVDDENPETSLPGGSSIAGIGFVAGVRCLVGASDAGINAGAITTAGMQKSLRLQRIAYENNLPTINLSESAGANLLDYRVEMWSDGGRSFANMALLSAKGLPVITVLHGSGTAGGAYVPGMSDVVIGVKERGMAFLAGPPLLKAATGEVAEEQELGGIEMHSTVSGLVDHVAEDDRDALRICREVVGAMHWGESWVDPSPPAFDEPLYDPDELCGVVPVDVKKGYDVREVVARVVDGSRFVDFKPAFGPATVCLEAEVHGHAVGIIGNNGPIDNAGANKATQFIQRMCQLGTPLVFLQNITGYMVGVESERGGMIKHGSKMIQAVATASVPKFTFVIGASYGAGNYGMAGQGYDPRFLFQWPNARSGVMGAEQAATTMRIVAEARAKRAGQELDEAFVEGFIAQIVALYEAQEPALVTSGRGLDDGVIDPRDTRAVLGFLLDTVAEGEDAELNPVSFGVARP